MRPRVFPAEDISRSANTPSSHGFNEAAGIPRGRQHRFDLRPNRPHGLASMRPRVFPAEDGGKREGMLRRQCTLQ